MHSSSLPLLRTAGLLASAALTATTLYAADKDPLPSFENSITLVAQGQSVKGSDSAFQTANWTSRKGIAGIQDFQYATTLKGDFALAADARALFGPEDYLAHLNLAKSELITVDLGYKSFRTYYDGIGGFFPNNSAWIPLANPELHVDRSQLWAGFTLAMPEAPVISLKYTNSLRHGTKDTTIWGDTDMTGIPNWTTAPTNPVSSNRKIVANWLQLSERHESLAGSVKHTLGNTTVEAAVVAERIDNLNTRGINRYPGEVRPFPRPTTTSASPTPAANVSDAISGFDRQNVESDALGFTGKVETLVGEHTKLFASVGYHTAETDFNGQRTLGSTVSTTPLGQITVVGGFAAGGRAPGAYTDLVGTSKVKTVTGIVGADLKFGSHLFVETSLKSEDRRIDASDSWTAISRSINQTTGVITQTLTANTARSATDETALIPELAVRYTGFRNLSLYGSADYRHSPGTEDVTNATTAATTTYKDVTENHGRYTVGANWTPCTAFGLRAETYLKNHKNSFYGYAASTGSRYVLGSEYRGVKLNVTVKPLPSLGFTTRYVYNTGTMDVTSGIKNTYESMDATSHQIGETIDWTPIKQFYMQAALNVTFDTTGTAYPRAGGTANDVLRNADNNSATASLLAGLVLDKATNAEIQYTHYKADNFEALYATQPYGAGTEDYSVTVGVKRKLTEKLVADAKVGYISSKNDMTGGYTDYSARVAYLTLTQAF